MSPKARMRTYVPVVRLFVTRVLLFHAAVAARLGLNAADVSSLRLLGEQPLSPGELSVQIGLTGAATTALLDRLERDGFVTRVRSAEDRRRVTVHADAKRLQEVDALYTGQGERMAKVLAQYSAAEFETVMSFLREITTVLTEEAEVMCGEQ